MLILFANHVDVGNPFTVITTIYLFLSNVNIKLEKKGAIESGYVLDFGEIKPVVRKLCNSLNDKMILPELSKELKFTKTENNHIEVK